MNAGANTRSSRRLRKTPKRYGEWEDVDSKMVKTELGKKTKEILWEVEDILDSRGEGTDEEILVRWANWTGGDSWVNLSWNPEIKKFLDRNRANPLSCSLVAKRIQPHAMGRVYSDSILLVRQAIFDNLGEIRHTSAERGRRARVCLKVPFSAEDFNLHFRNKIESIPSGSSNVSCHVTGDELTKVLGPSWNTRSFPSSTVTYVSFQEYIHLSWGYKERIDYSHELCPRCNFKGNEHNRPQKCESVPTPVIGLAWLALTLTRTRRNRIASIHSK